jgi:hypothetical protein
VDKPNLFVVFCVAHFPAAIFLLFFFSGFKVRASVPQKIRWHMTMQPGLKRRKKMSEDHPKNMMGMTKGKKKRTCASLAERELKPPSEWLRW